jgi:hypothetical protein
MSTHTDNVAEWLGRVLEENIYKPDSGLVSFISEHKVTLDKQVNNGLFSEGSDLFRLNLFMPGLAPGPPHHSNLTDNISHEFTLTAC